MGQKYKRGQLVSVAKWLNDTLGLEPEIDVTNTVSKLKELLKRASELVEVADEPTEETIEILSWAKGSPLFPDGVIPPTEEKTATAKEEKPIQAKEEKKKQTKKPEEDKTHSKNEEEIPQLPSKPRSRTKYTRNHAIVDCLKKGPISRTDLISASEKLWESETGEKSIGSGSYSAVSIAIPILLVAGCVVEKDSLYYWQGV